MPPGAVLLHVKCGGRVETYRAPAVSRHREMDRNAHRSWFNRWIVNNGVCRNVQVEVGAAGGLNCQGTDGTKMKCSLDCERELEV